jgi:hypothetical protein
MLNRLNGSLTRVTAPARALLCQKSRTEPVLEPNSGREGASAAVYLRRNGPSERNSAVGSIAPVNAECVRKPA